MSLRRRVMLGCSFVALVLLVADVLLASTIRSYLLERVDQQLAPAAFRALRLSSLRGQLPEGRPSFPDRPTQAQDQVFTELFIGRLGGGSAEIARLGTGFGRLEANPPALDQATIRNNVAAPGQDPRPFTVAAASGSSSWRVVAAGVPGTQDILVVGMNLDEMSATLRKLMEMAGLITAIVLLALLAVAGWMIKLGVEPMTHMTQTAEVIAGGDLSLRVATAGGGTEAGRLGRALNTMLEKIEGAFSAQKASEGQLRRFVADASHELRTPLTSIMGYAELWRQGSLEDPQDLKEALRRLDEEAVRMGLLVDDMLLLAELDEGHLLGQAPVALDELVADAVADARAVEPDRPITLESEPVEVMGDGARLRQVIANLLTNARIHTPSGTPVHVKLSRSDVNAVLEVADEGEGVDPELGRKLFERFFRADPARSRQRGGSGLGLAIVASVAEAHGGKASLVSREGRGACFVVEIPLLSSQLT